MKLFKLWFKTLKTAYPEAFHDEIDCALAWKAALNLIQSWIRENPSCGELEILQNMIKDELGNKKKF